MPVLPLRPTLNRIPGELPKIPSDQLVGNLEKLTKIQLLEIKGRQERLLSNKSRILKLPDKGKRIQDFHNKVIKELTHRDEVENASNLFSNLNIAANGQKKINNLEWTGKTDSDHGEIILDSDDEEETDPLKIIAQSKNIERKVKYLQPDTSLITDDDLKDIELFKLEKINNTMENSEKPVVEVNSKIVVINSKLEEEKLNRKDSLSSKNSSMASLDLDPHVLYLFEKSVDTQTERFKPYKTTKSNVHDPEKEKLRPLGKNWEVTAATPPPIQHPGAKILSLQDSVEIQTEYLVKLKKLQEDHAEERLKAKTAKFESMGIVLPKESTNKHTKLFAMYRNVLDYDSSQSDLEEETIDSDEGVRDDEEEKGGVSFVVYK